MSGAVCRALLKPHASEMHLISGELGSGKTHTAHKLVSGWFQANPRTQLLYITPFARKQTMDALFPKLPSFSSLLAIETPDTLAERILQQPSNSSSSSLLPESFQVLRTPQERFAMFASHVNGMGLDLLRPQSNPNANLGLVLDYLQTVKQCGVNPNELASVAKQDYELELSRCLGLWNSLLLAKRVYEKEDLVSLATIAPQVSLKQMYNFDPQLPVHVVVDDLHLFKPIHIKLLVNSLLPLASECVLLFDETSGDCYSHYSLRLKPVLESMCGERPTRQFALVRNVTTTPVLTEALSPGVDSLYSWVDKQLVGGKQVVVCTRTRFERDQVFELLQSRSGNQRRGRQQRTRFSVKRERTRLIQTLEVQAVLAMLQILTKEAEEDSAREWFLVFTSPFFTKYKASPDQVKEFAQKLTRQRMHPRDIMQGLGGDALRLVQDVDKLQADLRNELFTKQANALSLLCLNMLKLAGVEMDPYSLESERIAALFQLLKRIEFTKDVHTPICQVLQSLKTVLEQEEDEEDDEDGEQEGGQSYCTVATIQQACYLFAPKSVDRLCLVGGTSKRKPLATSSSRLPLPYDLLGVDPISDLEAESRSMHSLLARAKNNLMFTSQP
ncbi:hypothetical protein BASA81_002764 [Batrachochytrium salamandrivorans]|nr:hypothetical protein BASA81_002764 [Batrachochytrium salamandrivorans]